MVGGRPAVSALRRLLPGLILFLWILRFSTPSFFAAPPDATTFVVMGEGMAAGMSHFGLGETVQRWSFPSIVARQMGAFFPQPLFQEPGIGRAPGFPSASTQPPAPEQTTVRIGFPPTLFVFNLSVPGMRLADALTTRPIPPLLHEGDPQQTALNLILGYPVLALGESLPRWTQLEYAESMRPTMALIELGYFEALEAAVEADPGLLPDPEEFRRNYAEILKALGRLRASPVIVTTIPDPMDTAYFSTIESAAALLRLPAAALAALYEFEPGTRIAAPGLYEIGVQLLSGRVGALPSKSLISAEAAAVLSSRVQQLNGLILELAFEHGAVAYNLHGLFRRIRIEGNVAGERTLTADYLGGFYLLNGYYPGGVGHVLIANEILSLLNQRHSTAFLPTSVEEAAASDPAYLARPAAGPLYTPNQLQRMLPPERRPEFLRRARGSEPPAPASAFPIRQPKRLKGGS